MSKEIKYIITYRSVMRALASCAVRQSPYPCPDNLEKVLYAFHDSIKEELNDSSMNTYIKKFSSWKECHDWIAPKLHGIPEFREWNNRKNGRDGMGMTFMGEHDDGSVTLSKTKADDDFIDLDALTRNITSLAIEED